VPPPPAEDRIIGQGFFTGCFDFAQSDKWKLFINPMLQRRENFIPSPQPLSPKPENPHLRHFVPPPPAEDRIIGQVFFILDASTSLCMTNENSHLEG